MKRMSLRIIYVILYATCTCAYQNLALGKPAWQKTNYSGAWPWGADKAVDGRYTDRGALGNQCTISAVEQFTAEWRVDLGSVVGISYINIFYRTDNYPSPSGYHGRFAGFSLFISNTTLKGDGHLCFHEIQNVSGTPIEDQRINCSVHGRYVIYYNERKPNVTYPNYYSQYAYNELCELEVYGCPVSGYYGKYCNQTCPATCQGQQCDAVTGQCVKGCLSGYNGLQCSYRNLALRKPAWQMANYSGAWPWGADKAVDGNYTDRGATGNQCTISAIEQFTAEWRVDLQSVVSISHIKIFYRTDNLPRPSAYNGRFAGFFLYISNTTSKDDGYLCFHEIQNVSGTPIEDQRINCSVYGRYVIYYNERKPNVTYPNYYSQYAYNELCELEVYGCHIPGYYGEYCNQTCPVNCQNQQCDVNGDCVSGCLSGFQGLQCSYKCDGGMYSLNCTQSCGHCLNNEQCHNINGTCLHGCSPGYKGPGCRTKCDGKMYGVNCTQACGHCLNNEQCHHINGTCLHGCSPGYKGPNCKTKCDVGMYGHNCNEICGHCMNNTQCNHVNGTCPGGCSVGFKGFLCDKECDRGMYGINCTQSCGHCLSNEQCHHINGSCLQGCSKGYKGSLCVTKCDSGMYGINCSQVCGGHCINYEQCHHVNGTCLQGCSQGYKGSLCNSACDDGMYGENCNQTCGHCINNIQCNHVNGLCYKGCSVGFKGLLCDKECDGGMYGVNCNQVCGNCLNNDQCHHINGTCLQGCSKGYKGTLCNIACEVGKYGYNCNESCGRCINNTTCNHVNGTCPGGCSVGYTGSLCTNVCSRSYWGVNCKENCSTECVSQTCHHESGHCLSYAQTQSSDTCKNDYTITITSVVVSISIVLMSSLINFVIWRKMHKKETDVDTPNDKVYYNEFQSVDIRDKQSGQDMKISPYAELCELDHPNTYEELHQNAKAGEEI